MGLLGSSRSSMRIAVYHNLPSGGAKRAVFELIRRLGVAHEIDVFSLSSADHEFCDIRPFVRRHSIYPFHEHRLLRSPWGRLNQLQRERDLGALHQVNRQIAAAINTGGYDVVFAHPCRFISVPTVLSAIAIPTVYYLHESFGEQHALVLPRPYEHSNRIRSLLDCIDPLLYVHRHHLRAQQLLHVRSATRLLANSRQTQQCLMRDFGLHADVCYLGVDSDEFYPMPKVAKTNSVISVGELTPRKGFDFLIAGIARIPPHKRPALRLAYNSESLPERQYIQKLAAAHDVDLHLLGRLNTAQLAVEYNQARLCVYAPYAEPLGLVPLEAMACAIPVVAVGEGGVRETVVDGVTGHLVARDADQFAGAVLALLDEPAQAEQVGRQAREHILRSWTWESSSACIETQLLAVSGSGRQPLAHPKAIAAAAK
jgi:glycosyltransferase involved in cell wall biosynthesis